MNDIYLISKILAFATRYNPQHPLKGPESTLIFEKLKFCSNVLIMY